MVADHCCVATTDNSLRQFWHTIQHQHCKWSQWGWVLFGGRHLRTLLSFYPFLLLLHLSKAADSKGPPQRIPSTLIFPPWQRNQAKESGDKPNQMQALKRLHQPEEAKDKTMMSEVPLLWNKCSGKEVGAERTNWDRPEHSTDTWK